MNPIRMPILLLMASLLLAGCSGTGNLSREDTGLGVGAVAGGLLGSTVGRGGGQVAATVVGAVIGGVIGSQIGRDMDDRDRRLAEQAEYDALERGSSGRSRVWRNEENGHYGEIVPSRPYRRSGYHCRDYAHTVYMRGRPETLRGTACRNPDGTWSAA